MSEWQQQRAVLVAMVEMYRGAAESCDEFEYLEKAKALHTARADAIDKALALADRAAEVERLLAEYVDSVDGGWGSDERLDLIRRVRAHRNAAQQEGQGDGD